MDVLSQNKIDAILEALSTGVIKTEEFEETPGEIDYEKYDFRRPNKFSNEQLRTLQTLHDVFARLVSKFLTGYLRSGIEIEVAAVSQMTYEDFIGSIPNPAALTIFSLEPLKGMAIIQFDPMFIFPMIDLFLGGKGEGLNLAREFTDIEISLIHNLSSKILENLAIAWKDIVRVKPTIDFVETNPHLHQILSFNEIVALITLATRVGDAEGFINLCLPFPFVAPLVTNLAYHRNPKPDVEDVNIEETKRLEHLLGFPMIELTVLTGQTQITVDDFLHLQEGDVLLLDKKVNDDMDLYVGEFLKYKVQPGKLGSKLAVQVTALTAGGEQDD
ncbi:MAG: flagellar motor switch protein FliM [Peptococcaceae bacterium]|nr:flagellar motor switch protein FliM [Candidatus Syntrophopropionicum ammoniitolerans]